MPIQTKKHYIVILLPVEGLPVTGFYKTVATVASSRQEAAENAFNAVDSVVDRQQCLVTDGLDTQVFVATAPTQQFTAEAV